MRRIHDRKESTAIVCTAGQHNAPLPGAPEPRQTQRPGVDYRRQVGRRQPAETQGRRGPRPADCAPMHRQVHRRQTRVPDARAAGRQNCFRDGAMVCHPRGTRVLQTVSRAGLTCASFLYQSRQEALSARRSSTVGSMFSDVLDAYMMEFLLELWSSPSECPSSCASTRTSSRRLLYSKISIFWLKAYLMYCPSSNSPPIPT